MSKVSPENAQGSDSDSDDEARKSSDEEEEKEPTVEYTDLNKVSGYEKVKFEINERIPPPSKEELYGIKPDMPFTEISEIREDECRDAILNFSNENCCFGSGAARDMQFTKITPNTAFHYILETFSEKRTTSYETVPYKGEIVDGPENGAAPLPWDMECGFNCLFKDQVVKLEVPHTSVVKPCKRCEETGRVRCGRCHGRGTLRCGACYGRGSRRVRTQKGYRRRMCLACFGSGRKCCPKCGGCGDVVCPRCDGYKQLRCFIQLRVKFKNHSSDYVLEMTDLPDQLVEEAKGTAVFVQELNLVFPLTEYPIPKINENSEKMIAKHKTTYSSERIHKQRHTLRAVPVTEVEYLWSGQSNAFWVYGNQRKVYCPSYPQQCCWGCQIL